MLLENTKITLSVKEHQLVSDPNWILTKRVIIKKVQTLFEILSAQMKLTLIKEGTHLPLEIKHTLPKISKGENYKGLPYVVLDYPAILTKSDALAFRTIFWWGRYFGIHILLQGGSKKRFERAIYNKFSFLTAKKYFVCIGKNPWDHHFEKDNYIPINKLTRKQWEEIIQKQSFIKIAKKIPLKKWDEAPQIISDYFFELLLLLKT